jgi:two-component system, NtrC family, response regulator HydG
MRMTDMRAVDRVKASAFAVLRCLVGADFRSACPQFMHASPHADISAVSSRAAQIARSRVLVVDDDPDACDACRLALASNGYDVTAEVSALDALRKVSRGNFDLVVTDVTMPEMGGIELCRRIANGPNPVPVILLTGRGEMDMVIDALRVGAIDFLRKPIDARALSAAVARALTLTAKEVPGSPSERDPRKRARLGLELHSMVGHSLAMRQVYELVSVLSSSLASVLLQGESGTGKDVIAHAIHDSSQVKSGPFVALNCAAIPLGLLESELFGHARGAFTDAKHRSKGLFVEANGGTLLLDEIGELPLEMQPKLLRALQERTVRPIGGREEIPFDCRLITATNRDLEREVKNKRFREDLYYRLDVVRITVPPLRDRGDDILALARHFLARFDNNAQRKLSSSVERLLLAYRWPGNVRELENCIERAVTMAPADELRVDDLPSKIRAFEPTPRAVSLEVGGADVISLNEVERRHILRAMELANGNKTVAAQILGINRRTLQRRLKQFENGTDRAS